MILVAGKLGQVQIAAVYWFGGSPLCVRRLSWPLIPIYADQVAGADPGHFKAGTHFRFRPIPLKNSVRRKGQPPGARDSYILTVG